MQRRHDVVLCICVEVHTIFTVCADRHGCWHVNAGILLLKVKLRYAKTALCMAHVSQYL